MSRKKMTLSREILDFEWETSRCICITCPASHPLECIVGFISEWGVLLAGDTIESPLPVVNAESPAGQWNAGLHRKPQWLIRLCGGEEKIAQSRFEERAAGRPARSSAQPAPNQNAGRQIPVAQIIQAQTRAQFFKPRINANFANEKH